MGPTSRSRYGKRICDSAVIGESQRLCYSAAIIMSQMPFLAPSPREGPCRWTHVALRVRMAGTLNTCFAPPPREAAYAAQFLHLAVDAHLSGQRDAAEHFLRSADLPILRDWTESLWGRNSPHVVIGFRAPETLIANRTPVRMPTASEKADLHSRDGYHCRFCGLTAIRAEVRRRIVLAYPNAVGWGRTNASQHAAFQAMWAQYDHLIPHCKGGDNGKDNIVVTCAPCNFARMDYLMEEVGLLHPLLRPPVTSPWDGLERFR